MFGFLKPVKVTPEGEASVLVAGSTLPSDPTLDTAGNAHTLFVRSDNTIASTVVVTETFTAGTFHYNINYNASGLIVSISAWGAGASGLVNIGGVER